MSAGLAALMGILKGVGEFPEGLIAGDKQRLAETAEQRAAATLEESKRHNQALEDQAFVELDPTTASAVGLPAGKHRKELYPLFQKLAEDKIAREADVARRQRVGAAIDSIVRDEAPKTVTHDYSEAAMYSPEQPAPREVTTPGKRVPIPERLRRIIAAGATKDELEAMSPKPLTVGPGTAAIDPWTQEVIHDQPNKPSHENMAAYERLAFNRLVGEYQLGQFPHPPGSPEFAVELGLRTEKMIPAAPGTDVYRATDVPRGGMTAGGGSGRPSISRPVMPSDAALEDYARIDASAKILRSILTQLQEQGGLGEVAGGMFKNPVGAAMRASDRVFGVGLNEKQRAALAQLEERLQHVKQMLIGATRTRPELADIAYAIPDAKGFLTGDTGAQLVPKLQAMLQTLDADRESREAVSGGVGKAVPPRLPGSTTAPKAPAAQSPTIWILKDLKTGRTRRYQPDPGETVPPAGYERVK